MINQYIAIRDDHLTMKVYMDACNLKYTEGTVVTDGKALNPKWHEFYMKALNEAKVIIYCITDAYYQSQWCRMEMENAFKRNDAWHIFVFLHKKDQVKIKVRICSILRKW